jgi:hypothetical protein
MNQLAEPRAAREPQSGMGSYRESIVSPPAVLRRLAGSRTNNLGETKHAKGQRPNGNGSSKRDAIALTSAPE